MCAGHWCAPTATSTCSGTSTGTRTGACTCTSRTSIAGITGAGCGCHPVVITTVIVEVEAAACQVGGRGVLGIEPEHIPIVLQLAEVLSKLGELCRCATVESHGQRRIDAIAAHELGSPTAVSTQVTLPWNMHTATSGPWHNTRRPAPSIQPRTGPPNAVNGTHS